MSSTEEVLYREFNKLIEKDNMFQSLIVFCKTGICHFSFNGVKISPIDALVKKVTHSKPEEIVPIFMAGFDITSPIGTEAYRQLVNIDLYAAYVAGKAIVNLHTSNVTGV